MRTTLTIDSDVAAAIEELRRQHKLTLKEAVNQTLRHGLQRPPKSSTSGTRFRTRTVHHGQLLSGTLDNIAGVLAVIEGERFR
jgi:hypothetical protein